ADRSVGGAAGALEGGWGELVSLEHAVLRHRRAAALDRADAAAQAGRGEEPAHSRPFRGARKGGQSKSEMAEIGAISRSRGHGRVVRQKSPLDVRAHPAYVPLPS